MKAWSPDLELNREKVVQDDKDVPDLWGETATRAPSFDFSFIGLYLRRNWLRIGLASLLLGGCIFGGLLLAFRKYTATATIIIDPRTANVTQGASVLPNIGADVIAIESVVQSAKSESFLGALVDQLKLADDGEFPDREAAIEKLAGQLAINRRGTTYVIDTNAMSRSAEKSAVIANAAAQAIIDNQRELRAGVDETTVRDISSRLEDARARLQRAEQATAELKSRLEVTDVGQGTTLLERRIYELNQQLVLANAKTADLRARYDQLRQKSATDDIGPFPESTVINNLRVVYARLVSQGADQATVLGPRHPDVIRMKAQINDLRTRIDAERTRLTGLARADLAEAEQRDAAIARQLREAREKSEGLNLDLVKLGELEREAKADRTIYEQLLTRQNELVSSKNLEPSDVHFVSRATPPTKIKPGIALRAAAASLLGLLGGLAYAFAREKADDALKTPRQAESAVGRKVAGLAPDVGARGGARRRPDLAPWMGDLCAAAVGNRKGSMAILVASACKGAGRSSVARNMAAFLAQGGALVLLIEADAAAPGASKQDVGLLDVLAERANPNEAFVESGGYTLLPYGGREMQQSASAAALMSGVTFGAMLKSCRERFEYVVIDGPAALVSGHARQLARQTDMTVLVLEWNKTTPREANDALDRLSAKEAVLFFNKVDLARFGQFDPARSRVLAAQAKEIGGQP